MEKKSVKVKVAMVLAGVLLCLSLLEILLRTGGFLLLYNREKQNRASSGQKNIYTILCIGESTAAVAADSTNRFLVDSASYPRQLERILNKDSGDQIYYKVINKGIIAGDSAQILEELEDNLNQFRPNMVIAMMGIRDDANTPLFKGISPLPKRHRKLSLKELKIYKLVKMLSEIFSEKRRDPEQGGPMLQRRILGLLCKLYREKRGPQQLEKMLKKLTGLNSKFAYIELEKLYREEKKFKEAEALFKEAIQKIRDAQLYLEFGNLCQELGEYEKAEGIFKKGIGASDKKHALYLALAILYREQKRYVEEEAIYKKAMLINKRYGGYLRLANYYGSQGRNKEAKEVLKIALEAIPAIRHNYKKLQEILLARGIALVAMQYPGYNIEWLKEVLQPQEKNPVIVDNERIFDAGPHNEFYLEEARYLFPHYTKKGAEVLSENIAETLQREHFNRR